MTCQFQYSGNMINELYAMTDNVLDLARIKREAERCWPSSIPPDRYDEPQLPTDPFQVFVNARSHLADLPMDAAREEAYRLLGEFQTCFLTGMTDLCECGALEGRHGYITEICPEKELCRFKRAHREDA